VKFITYAVWWIRQAIFQLLAGQSRAFSVPQRLSASAARFRRDVAALTTHLDRAPTSAEIADELDLSKADVAALERIAGSDVSLSAPVAGDGDDRELLDTIEQELVPPVEDELLRDTLVTATRRAMAELNPREREVMRLRFGIDEDGPLTLQQIGDRFKLSRERVRQIETRAREKLRRSKRLREIRASLN
jgi:RNA polymerase primary sigma factor